MLVLVTLARTIRIVPQARAGVIERLGRYNRTLSPGLAIVVPFVDRLRPLIDLREQVVSFPPQPVITEDNLVVTIDTVIYFQVTDAKAATYEIANYIQAIEQLTVTTLRNVIGGMDAREDAHLARRDQRPAARRARRGDRQVGDPRQPRRAEGDRPAASIQDIDGEADARRPREARRDPHGRGREAVADPHRRRREAVRDPEGRRRAAGDDPARPRGRPRRSTPSSRRSTRATPTRSCSRTSTSRCCRRSRRVTANKIWIIPSELTHALGRIEELVRPQRNAVAPTGVPNSRADMNAGAP